MDLLSRSLITRLKLVVIALCILLLGMIAHLFNLQIRLTTNFFQLGQKNFVRYEKVSSPRGNIVDIHGKLLATNRPITRIYWQGTGKKSLTSEQLHALAQLGNNLPISSEIIAKITTAEKQGQRLLIAQDINFELLSKIIEQFPEHANILVKRHFKRYYPQNTVASHVVGYLGFIDMEPKGRMGLEQLFEDTLKGDPGQIVKTINSVGRHLAEEEVKQALSGSTVYTTLNLDLQLIAEEVFPKHESGALIVMDPKVGNIEVLLSRPSFDPNIFLSSLASQTWHDLQEKKCFINRALNACYPPASLFKLVTISAALENHLISADTTWHCNGSIQFADRTIYCHKRVGHGQMNTEQALAHSCNIPFYDIGKKMKIDSLADYAMRLGLGVKTNILLPEKAGLVPTSSWKRQIKGEPWWPGETLSAAIGQSYLLVTPMQIACMISALCQGYLVQPRMLTAEQIVKKPLEISKDTLQFLKKSMKRVIDGGSGKSLNTLADIEIFAKTGTAQTSNLSKREMGKKFIEHGWFVAHFRYKNNDPLTLVILIENVGSSRFATQVALDFLKSYIELVRPDTKVI